MSKDTFVHLITSTIAGHIARETGAHHVIHNYTENLLMQIKKISDSNPQLDELQILAVMFAENPESNVFEVAYDEMNKPGQTLLAINFRYIPEAHAPKVVALLVGPGDFNDQNPVTDGQRSPGINLH